MKNSRKGFIFLTLLVLSSVVVAFLSIAVWVWHIDRTWAPLLEPRIRERQEAGSVRVLALTRDGQKKWIGSLTAGRMEERKALPLSELPPQLIQAIVVLEDPRFLEHGGFDIWGIMRAAWVNLKNMRVSQGGSTITQQLVKNVFLTREKTFSRKFTELVLAALIEKRFSKDEILETYMNEVYLGQLGSVEIHGVARASDYYFSKPVSELEIHEMALIAAIINGPGYYSPWKAPERTIARRNRTLKALLDAGFILNEEYEQAITKPLPGPSAFLATTRAPYLMDALREKILQERTEIELIKGGFDVVLGLDLALQEVAEKTLAAKAKEWGPSLQGLIVAADPRSCEVRLYVGGTDYRITQLDRVRQSKRPIGSLMKPIVSARLLNDDEKLTLATSLDDQPLDWLYDNGRSRWKPVNYDQKFRGKVTFRETLEQSLNVPFARVFFEREPSGLLQDLLDPARALGLEIPPDRALPSAVLGAIEQSPWNTLSAYVKLARQALGLAQDAGDFSCQLKLASAGLSSDQTQTQQEVVSAPFGQEGARLTLAALEGALRRGTSAALGKRLPLNQAWAGKTGTSSDKRDSWYVALSPTLVVLSWVGSDDNKATAFTGASGAMPLAMPSIMEWSQRLSEESAEGGAFQWPLTDNLSWSLVRVKDYCRPAERIREEFAADKLEIPSATTPPPEAKSLRENVYYYELFKSGTHAPDCES